MNALIIELVLLQLVLPLALVLAHATLRPASLLGLALRVVGIAALLVHLALTGVWLFPPWWTPWALALLHALATVRAYRLLAARAQAATATSRVVESGLGTLVIVLALTLLVPAVTGRRAPPETVDLAAPLEAGDYLVTSGGTSLSVNNHLDFTADRYRPSWGQNHAVDLIAIDRWGLRADGLSPVEPSRYLIHGRRVLAPCAGTVQASADDAPDMPVPTMDRERLLGNHVILGCENGVYVVLAHLAPGTVQVSPGDAVAVGETLGHAGNSGKSAEPHLHIHVQRDLPPDAPIGGESLWFTIDGRFLARGDILSVS